MSITTQAARLDNVKITMLMLDDVHGNKVYLRTEPKHPHQDPSCHASGWDFVLPIRDGHDDKIYTLLLTAQAADRPVNLVGYAHCDDHGGIETLRRVEMN